jgi:eukaryotic-like serine/threonine-protein kinase
MKTIAKYKIVEELGASAAGTTFRVSDCFRNREFALKLLPAFPGFENGLREQFYRHLSACEEIKHRQIASIHDIGEVENGTYIATALLSGLNLERHVQATSGIAITQKLTWIAQVCEGLAFAHSKGIAHGNLKPGNIFIGAGSDATILDFGTGRWHALLLASNIRPQGLLCNYFAPEQILGQSFDARSDVFSIGLIFYQLLAGRYPFQVPAGLIPREIVHSDPESLRKQDPQIPEDLDQLVSQALKKNPQERLQTADEFAARLYAIAQQLRRAPAQVVVQAVAPPADPVVVNQPSLSEAPVATAPAVAASLEAAPAAPLPKAPPAIQAEIVAASAPAAAPQVPTIAPPLPSPEPAATVPSPAPTRPITQPVRRPGGRIARPMPKPRKPATLGKRAMTIAAGAVIAIGIVGSFVARQHLGASPDKSPAPITQSKPVVPEPASLPQTHAPIPPPVAPAVSPLSQTRSNPEQILRAKVKRLWEAGKYAEAMTVADEMLAASPASDEARAWKKKIRAAQDAEAAIK